MKIKQKKRKQCSRLILTYINFVGARYFDQGVFPEGDGLDTPLSHPSLDFVNEDPQIQDPQNPFGFYNFPSVQDISDIVFNINNTDSGNNGRVPHLFRRLGN